MTWKVTGRMVNFPIDALLPFFPSPTQVKIVPMRVKGVSSEGDCCVCHYHSNPIALETEAQRPGLQHGYSFHLCHFLLKVLCQDLQCDRCVAKSSPQFSVTSYLSMGHGQLCPQWTLSSRGCQDIILLAFLPPYWSSPVSLLPDLLIM